MPQEKSKKLDLAIARAERFKKARMEAENLLEQKSRELYAANKKLEKAQKNLQEDIKQATYELKVTNTRLQSALDEKSAFLGQMSHEVRTPLNAIIGLSEILLGAELGETEFDYVNTINHGAKSMIVLINDLLDITKIEAGRVDIRPELVRTHDLFRNIMGMFELSAKQLGLTLDLEIADSVPDIIKIDVGRYKQIINNLLSNAIKNTPAGRVLVRVTQEDTVNSSGMFVTEVIDTGVGIQANKLELIFNAYEQIGRPNQGSGLGLSICRQLCDLMGGNIGCESTLAKGSCFRVELPIHAASPPSLDAQTQLVASLPTLAKLKILVAEDNPINQKVLAAQLQQLNQTADITNNGQEALDMLSSKQYDAVIMDILMPVLGGEETLQKIRESASEIASHYCIALTASSYKDQKDRLLKLGFDAFLSKPLGLQELADALAKIPVSLAKPPTREPTVVDLPTETESHLESFDFTYLETQFGEAYRLIFQEIAPTFLDHGYTELDQLMAHVQAGNIDKIRKTSHSMKGAASSIGLDELADLLLRIESKPEALDVASKVSEVQIFMQRIKPLIVNELTQGRDEG